jgi:hypothetical protein
MAKGQIYENVLAEQSPPTPQLQMMHINGGRPDSDGYLIYLHIFVKKHMYCTRTVYITFAYRIIFLSGGFKNM